MYAVAEIGNALYLMVKDETDPNLRPVAVFVADSIDEIRERALEMCAVLNGDLDASAGIEVVEPECAEEPVEEKGEMIDLTQPKDEGEGNATNPY